MALQHYSAIQNNFVFPQIMISDDSSGSPRPSIQELGRAMSAKMAAQIQQHMAAAKALGQGQPSAPMTTAPPILQSSSVPGSASLPKNAAPPTSGKGAGPATVVQTAQPPKVTKAVHQLPGRIIKMTSGLPATVVNAPRVAGLVRRSSQPNSDPVPMDTSPGPSGSEKMPPSGASQQSSGRLMTSVRKTSNGNEVLPVDLARASTSMRTDLNPAEERLACAAKSSIGLRRDLNLAEAEKVGTAEAVARNVFMQGFVMKALAEKRNGGHPDGVSSPALAEVLPLGLTAAVVSASPTSSAVGGPRYAPVLSMARVTPLPTPTSSVVTSPAISSIGLASSSSTATPSAAHSQHTRPLLLFRSTSVDPGSGDGRRMGSVELRHVTADALLALQQSSSNSINPANQNLKSVPLAFEQQIHSMLLARAGAGVGTGVPRETDQVPPISNHVSRERLQHRQLSRDEDGDSDEPKDLSLKSRRKDMTGSDPKADFAAKWPAWDAASQSAPLEKEYPSRDAASGERKQKAGSSQSQKGHSKPTPRKQQRAKRTKPKPSGANAASGTEKDSFSPRHFVEDGLTTEVGEEKKVDPNKGQGFFKSESGHATSELDSDVKTAVVDMTRGAMDCKQEEKSSRVKPLKKSVDIPKGKQVLIAQRNLRTNLSSSVPGRTTPVQEKTATIKGKTVSAVESQGSSTRSYAKDKSDQNDNVDEGFPRLPALESKPTDTEGSPANLTLENKAEHAPMETD